MNNLSCDYILSLLSIYIENKTTVEQSVAIDEHLNSCNECFEKYINLRNYSNSLNSCVKSLKYYSGEEDFIDKNLSAYIDNELSKDEYIDFNRVITHSQEAKYKLEDMMFFDEQLQHCLNNDKHHLKKDLSKKVINDVKKENKDFLANVYLQYFAFLIIFSVLTIFAVNYKNIFNEDNITSLKKEFLQIVKLN